MTPHAAVSGRPPKQPRTIAGVTLAFLGAVALTIGVTGSPAAGLSGTENAPLNRSAQASADCSNGVLVGMNFVVVPIDDDYFFDSITMNLGGDVRTFSGSDLVQNGGRADDVFIAAPAGLDYDDVVAATWTAAIGPFGYGYPTFDFSYVCEPAPTTTTVAPTTTTVAPTTTTTLAATTTTEAGEAGAPTTTTTTTTPTEDTVQNVAPTTVGTDSNSPTTVATQLPRTGPDTTDTLLVLGALLLLVGGVMVLSARREQDLV